MFTFEIRVNDKDIRIYQAFLRNFIIILVMFYKIRKNVTTYLSTGTFYSLTKLKQNTYIFDLKPNCIL